MEIDPLSSRNLPDPPGAGPQKPGAAGGEGSQFQQLLAEVHQKQRQADLAVQRTLLGEGELHEAILALEHADLAFRLLVQVRNKLLQAYEELNRITL